MVKIWKTYGNDMENLGNMENIWEKYGKHMETNMDATKRAVKVMGTL